jgi:general secretion pathway protein G
MVGRIHARRRNLKAQRGFTLVELLVVITIIALIMGVVGPRVLNYLTESKAKTAKIQIESFASALDLFFLDTGRYPNSPKASPRWCGARQHQRLERPLPEGRPGAADPWGNRTSTARRAARDLRHPFLRSDGTEGGTGAAQDITSWQR